MLTLCDKLYPVIFRQRATTYFDKGLQNETIEIVSDQDKSLYWLEIMIRQVPGLKTQPVRFLGIPTGVSKT